MGAIREIKLSGDNNLFTIVDEEDYWTLRLSGYRFHAVIGRNTIYVTTSKNGKEIKLHRIIMGLVDAPRSVMVDHKDGNGLNNSRTNLRVTDNRGNQYNRRKHLSAKFTSTYKGVSWVGSYNKSNPWVARIELSGKTKHLGCYRTEIEAAQSYNEAATKHYGTMARLNLLPD